MISLSAVGTAVAFSTCLMGQAPVFRVGSLQSPDPWVNTTVVNNDGNGRTIVKIEQCEVRSVGSGVYQIAAAVHFLDPATSLPTADTTLITGLLILTVNPPLWIPNQDVAALSVAGTTVDEYQFSLSADGLTAVWDRYGPAAPNTFCCRRSSTGVPFAQANIRSVSPVGAGGVDPHIGEELPNGHVTLFFIQVSPINGTSSAPIVRADLDPLTGLLGPTTLVATYQGVGAAGFNHSPFVYRDSTGKARALNFSEFPASGPQHSNAIFTEGVNNDGTPEVILDGGPSGTWFNNPGLVGGTWHYCTSAQTEPQLQEAVLLANADFRSGGGRIVAWAPVRPQGNGLFFSAVIAGVDVVSLNIPPYQLPPVSNDLWVFDTLGVTGIGLHDPYSGIAEWVYSGLTPLNATFQMQVVSLDFATNLIFASNQARLDF
jgi:hypothetical protein